MLVGKESGWRFETSSGLELGGGEIVAFAGGSASFVAISPIGNRRTLNYVFLGMGLGFGAKVSVSGSKESYESRGIIYKSPTYPGAELQISDLTGLCMFAEISGGLVNGGSGVAMFLGLKGAAKAAVTSIYLTVKGEIAHPTANAVLIMGGYNRGVQIGGSVIGATGYVWAT